MPAVRAEDLDGSLKGPKGTVQSHSGGLEGYSVHVIVVGALTEAPRLRSRERRTRDGGCEGVPHADAGGSRRSKGALPRLSAHYIRVRGSHVDLFIGFVPNS